MPTELFASTRCCALAYLHSCYLATFPRHKVARLHPLASVPFWSPSADGKGYNGGTLTHLHNSLHTSCDRIDNETKSVLRINFPNERFLLNLCQFQSHKSAAD
jgi:hypothetical protein